MCVEPSAVHTDTAIPTRNLKFADGSTVKKTQQHAKELKITTA